jgi:hypothetical protein
MQKNKLTRSGGWLLLTVGLIMGFIELDAAAAIAPPIQLAWQPADDPAVKGYAIYYGAVDESNLNRIDTGSNTSSTISNLLVGVTYRIYAVSYGAQSVESIPSNELLFTPLAPSDPPSDPPPVTGALGSVTITRQSDGNMLLQGTAPPGATCQVLYAASPNPSSWQPRATVVADAGGKISYLDSTARYSNRRFYRMVLP